MVASVAGAAVLAALGLDVYGTVLHPSSGAGPYTSVQNRVIWRITRGIARRVPGQARLLSNAAPLMALATPAAWVTWLILGFALLYQPVLPSFSQDPAVAEGSWVAALYYSGYVTTTLGLGDVTPAGATWRMVTVVHAALGFAMFSASITYILSVYRKHADDAALALHLHDLFRRDPGAPSDVGGTEIASVARSLAAVNVAHRQYPILHYFHDPESTSLPVQLGHVVDWLERSGEPRTAPARALDRAVEGFLDQMPFGPDGDAAPDLRARHRSLLKAHLREVPGGGR